MSKFYDASAAGKMTHDFFLLFSDQQLSSDLDFVGRFRDISMSGLEKNSPDRVEKFESKHPKDCLDEKRENRRALV